MRLVLSIYIPSYEKGLLLMRLVNSLLRIKDSRFEIIILDDCSQDGTWELINNISDDRVKKIRNKENLGPIETWGEAISLCKGDWILHFNDRDECNTRLLTKYIDYLQALDDSVAFVFPNAVHNDEYYKAGREVYKKFSYFVCHPTGVTMRRKMLDGINWQHYFSYEKYGMYPHGYILADISRNWSVVRSTYRIWRESYSTFKSNKNFWTSNTNGNTNIPKGKIYSDLSCAEYNLERNFNHILKNKNSNFFTKIQGVYYTYYRNLKICTFGYSYDIADPDRAHHYGLKSYSPNYVELLKRVKTIKWFSIDKIWKINGCYILCILWANIEWFVASISEVPEWKDINGLKL